MRGGRWRKCGSATSCGKVDNQLGYALMLAPLVTGLTRNLFGHQSSLDGGTKMESIPRRDAVGWESLSSEDILHGSERERWYQSG
jgi:hypothetical protein